MSAELTVHSRGRTKTFARKPRRTGCWACFDMAAGNLHVCDACSQSYGARRLPENERPPRPPMPPIGDQS